MQQQPTTTILPRRKDHGAHDAFVIAACTVLSAGLFLVPFFGLHAQLGTVTNTVGIVVTITGPEPTPTPSATPTPPPPSGGGGGAVLPPAGDTTVILTGKAYPHAFITAMKNAQVASTLTAGDDGVFAFRLTAVQAGIYTFGVYAQDPKGRKSLTISFTTSVIANMTTTVSGIFIPPTIATDRDIYYTDETITLEGYAFPQSNVHLFINSHEEVLERVISTEDGAWTLARGLSDLGVEEHGVRAQAQAPDGDQSTFSETKLFRIFRRGDVIPTPTGAPSGPSCRGADLNRDGKVNLTDFSIMLYWWQSRNPQHPCVDINKDGIVNITDFSVMMFQWTR